MSEENGFDALVPAAIAQRAETVGIRKAQTPTFQLFVLSILAGAFIAMGAVFATTVSAGTSGALPYGVTRFLMGLAFCLGLTLVVLAGAELFTGNNLIIMAWANKKITTGALLRNWGIVYLGNFVGSIATALLMIASKQYAFGAGAVGKVALGTAVAKVNLGFGQAIALGIFCNALVCLAVWLCYGAHSTVDKIVAIILPITAFVAAGFEHSVANMYYIPFGLFLKALDPAFVATTEVATDSLTWGSFLLKNLLPVTIGNIIGGAFLVVIVYWSVYLKDRH
ncbi:MAG: formate/nitrite transporter family protein [Anaerolineaceae bacterium]